MALEEVVALYDFDPASIDWPFPAQKTLGFSVTQILTILVDDGSGWVLGHLRGLPEVKGYFPKNYTIALSEYNAMLGQYQGVTTKAPTVPAAPTEKGGKIGREVPPTRKRGMAEVPLSQEEIAGMDETAREQFQVERDLAQIGDAFQNRTASMDSSRCSTPVTELNTRPERDFVRTHVGMDLQGQYMRPMADLGALCKNKVVKVAWAPKPAYMIDMRVRAATVRMAQEMKPGNMRLALSTSAANGARWEQPFRPGFNDIVNETVRTGSGACMLSDLYNRDEIAREQFQKIHVRDTGGIMWFDLQRHLDSVYYMNADSVDIMMQHPDAWGYPDISRQVCANTGEPIDPFHGWMSRSAENAAKEMADVDFLYTLTVRTFPEKTFKALSLGKIPEWADPYSVSVEIPNAETGPPNVTPTQEEMEEPASPARPKYRVGLDQLRDAGLDDGMEVYVQIGSDGKVKERVLTPDVLDTNVRPSMIKGISAMGIYMRSRSNPDDIKSTPISPKMVKDMAAMFGIRDRPSAFWYCMFALRYPLAPEWEVIVKDDTRWYLHLPTDRLQPVHPMAKRFREHLDDCLQNEFLWDFREPPVVKFKCAECGIPDSILWCMQCTDYFCSGCFFKSHRTQRGKKHWPMPVPGTRYLTAAESARLRDHLPLLNVGFSNRRRFLARENQSDKNGSRQGDTWLFFQADTFQSALQQAPEKHWFLKRLNPPRLAPNTDGYYYNFASDIVADDASHILTKAHEQKALSALQKNMRGAITRRRVKKEVVAARQIQGAKRMWDVRAIHGKNGKNSDILKKWYSKYAAKQNREHLERRISRIQACFVGFEARRDFHEVLTNVRRFQSNYRGLIARRRDATRRRAACTVIRYYRGRIYGRLPMKQQREGACKIQAMVRGMLARSLLRMRIVNAAYIQSHARGMLTRKKVQRMYRASIAIQSNWRRFQSQLDAKLILYELLEGIRRKRLRAVREKLEEMAALCIQRCFRRHHLYKKCVYVRSEKCEADKKTSTLLVAIYMSASRMRDFVHPFFRHLPNDVQEVLMQVKASMQRTIALVPVTGKLANEEVGRRGVRVMDKKHLEYQTVRRDEIDLASHVLLAVSRHLLPQVPKNLFPSTIKWACYSVSHQAVVTDRFPYSIPLETIPVGKDPTLPAHPGDSMATMWEDFGTVKHLHDWLMTFANESVPCLILKGLPDRLKRIFLTAQILITMRQALDAPSVSTEDHLKFQGLDALAGAQLMEVLGCEMEHRLPLDWPKIHGTVSALANETCNHIIGFEIEPLPEEKKHDTKDKEGDEPEKEKPKEREKSPAKSGAKAKADAKLGGTKKGPGGSKKTEKAAAVVPKTESETPEQLQETTALVPSSLPELPVGGHISHFNRHLMMRIVQQMGYYMCGQDAAMEAVLVDGNAPTGTGGARQSRYVSIVDKLFEMSDRATHDHCSFVLSVVIFHMVLRGLMLRVLYHRAAIAIQTVFRYKRNKILKVKYIVPAIGIQRFWRGLSAALRSMRIDDAAEKIQNSYRAWRWNKRARILQKATIRIQRFWHSTVHRAWIGRCHSSAKCIQRHARGMMVRWCLDARGRQVYRKYQAWIDDLVEKKMAGEIKKAAYLEQAAAISAEGKAALHQHRERNIEKHRMASMSNQTASSRMVAKQKRLQATGFIQPARETVFEPMIFALVRLDPVQSNRYLVRNSKVLPQVDDAKRKLNRYLPPRTLRVTPFHKVSRRGRAAILAFRLAKQSKVPRPRTQAVAVEMPTVSDEILGLCRQGEFLQWMTKQLAVAA